MAFYSSHPPIQLYAYAPMPIPSQPEFYAVYPPGGPTAGVVDASAFYYDAPPKGMVAQSGKPKAQKYLTKTQQNIWKKVQVQKHTCIVAGSSENHWVSLLFHPHKAELSMTQPQNM